MRKTIRQIYMWVLGIGIGYWLWLQITGIGIPCILWERTGLLCPGCGTSRMFLSLIRGDLAAAWGYNWLVLCLLILWNAIAALCYWGKPGFFRNPKFLFTAGYLTFAGLILFGILRNFS